MTSPRTDPWSPNDPAVLAWIERALGDGARVVRVVDMPASSTAKHRIEVALADGSERRLVLRRYHDAARRARDPWYAPANEAHALELLADTAVPAPRLVAADLDAAVCDAPAILESWMPGEPGWRAEPLDVYLARAAEALAAIHAVRLPDRARLPRYAPYRGTDPVQAPRDSVRKDLWQRLAAILDRPPPVHGETLIHRDFHPGNVLWDGARIAVVDWATAAWGPPGVDLARIRVNLAVHSAAAAADDFVDAYVRAGGDPAAHHPYWDLLDTADFALDSDLPEPEAARLERHIDNVLAEHARRAADEEHA